uniref:Tyrosine-protein phosphatase domain-containing protein n=1 Tax=Calidris pygmaea TaxID=425635 RepID=A0A8C3J3W1_9CHAR
MAGLELCEPRHLYNILNQHRRYPRLAEPHYLCLLDVRTQREYNESHIITARRIEQELENFQPYPVEILPAKLYMGNFKQACDQQIQKDLKIKAQVNISEQHLDHGAVLVFSSLGISRSSTVTIAYLMHSCQFSLKRAWDYVLKCKTNMRPHRGFVKQLSDWETKIYRSTITDTSEPNY